MLLKCKTTATLEWNPRGVAWFYYTERAMPNANGLSGRTALCFPRRPLIEISGPVHPLWCEPRDTPWVTAMRRQVATATLIGGRGFARAWRFRSI
jgi:hypothetical protein